MTLDEVIKDMETIAEENQRVVDTGIVFKDVTIDMIYCDDTEAIEEHLANYQKVAEKYRQLAEWLKELKQLMEQEPVIDKIRAEIEQAADKQFQIAMGVADLNERYTHIQMENAYRHSLNIIDKYKAEIEPRESEE